MYENIVNSLRYCADNDCSPKCPRAGIGKGCIAGLKREAAEAIEELQKRVPKRPHGKLIDADEFLKNAQLQRCFRGDYALLLNDVIEQCATIIPAEEGE